MRKSDVEKAARALGKLEEKRMEIAAQKERAEAALAAARSRQSELARLERLVVLGELDAKEAGRKAREIEGADRGGYAEAARRRRGCHRA